MALAAGSGFYLCLKRAKAYSVELKQAEDLIFWLVIFGFLGARLYHVLSDVAFYWQNPLNILMVQKGGLSIYGAVLGGALSLPFLKKYLKINLSFSSLLDFLLPGVLLGQIIGRFGNFFNYEAFGYPTNLPWKMFVPAEFRPGGYGQFSFFHPWFLYESLGNFFILLILLKTTKASKSGKIAFLYLLLYNLLRFCLEFLRIDSTFILGLRLNAVVSGLIVILSAGALFFLKTNDRSP